MSSKAHLQVTHMDDTWTDIEFGSPGAVTWLPSAQGLVVKLDWQGQRTVFPWATVKSYTVMPRDKPDNPEVFSGPGVTGFPREGFPLDRS
jgi:hypothetical protein